MTSRTDPSLLRWVFWCDWCMKRVSVQQSQTATTTLDGYDGRTPWEVGG